MPINQGFSFNPTSCLHRDWLRRLLTPGRIPNCLRLLSGGRLRGAEVRPFVHFYDRRAIASKADGVSLNFKIAYPKGAVGSQSWFKDV